MKKTIKLSTLVASIAFAGSAISAPYDGNLSGLDSSTGAKVGSVAIALASNTDLRDALQVVEFGAGTPCVGSASALCMPSLSSAEVRLLLTSASTDLRAAVNSGHNPTFADYSFTGAQCTAAEERDGDMWEVARCAIGGVKGPFIDRYVPSESGVAVSSFANAGACGTSAAIPASGTSASVLATLAAATTRHAFAAVPVTELAGVAGVGFIKLDGQSPDLASYSSGNYGFGSNVLGAGSAPADSAAPFGTVGVATQAALGTATPYNQNAGLTTGDCESLFVGAPILR